MKTRATMKTPTLSCGLFLLCALVMSMPMARAAPGDALYVTEAGGALYTAPNGKAPVIFPLDVGRELTEMTRQQDWFKARDNATGLVGWVEVPLMSSTLPEGLDPLMVDDGKAAFAAFEERVSFLNNAVAEATGQTLFSRIEHMGGSAARVFADTMWFESRRSEQQAFRIFSLWKMANGGQPVFLSFSDDQGQERFIVLDGPNRPRLLTTSSD